MSNAVLYAGLVGKYIRMERPATDRESAYGPDTVGMECLVARVHDEAGPGTGDRWRAPRRAVRSAGLPRLPVHASPVRQPPLPCSRYPQCRRECTWPTCTEKTPNHRSTGAT